MWRRKNLSQLNRGNLKKKTFSLNHHFWVFGHLNIRNLKYKSFIRSLLGTYSFVKVTNIAVYEIHKDFSKIYFSDNNYYPPTWMSMKTVMSVS